MWECAAFVLGHLVVRLLMTGQTLWDYCLEAEVTPVCVRRGIEQYNLMGHLISGRRQTKVDAF